MSAPPIYVPQRIESEHFQKGYDFAYNQITDWRLHNARRYYEERKEKGGEQGEEEWNAFNDGLVQGKEDIENPDTDIGNRVEKYKAKEAVLNRAYKGKRVQNQGGSKRRKTRKQRKQSKKSRKHRK